MGDRRQHRGACGFGLWKDCTYVKKRERIFGGKLRNKGFLATNQGMKIMNLIRNILQVQGKRLSLPFPRPF